MNEITMRFDGFTLIVNPKHNFVIYMNWLGQVERYTLGAFIKVLERVAASKSL